MEGQRILLQLRRDLVEETVDGEHVERVRDRPPGPELNPHRNGGVLDEEVSDVIRKVSSARYVVHLGILDIGPEDVREKR